MIAVQYKHIKDAFDHIVFFDFLALFLCYPLLDDGTDSSFQQTLQFFHQLLLETTTSLLAHNEASIGSLASRIFIMKNGVNFVVFCQLVR